MSYFCLKLVKCNEYLVSAVGTDGLVFYHQAFSNNSVEYGPMRFKLFVG